MDIRARTQQRQCRGEASDAAAYDRYGEWLALYQIALRSFREGSGMMLLSMSRLPHAF